MVAKKRLNVQGHCKSKSPFQKQWGNGYKLSALRFLGSFGWTNVTCTYDWLIVALNTIDQS